MLPSSPANCGNYEINQFYRICGQESQKHLRLRKCLELPVVAGKILSFLSENLAMAASGSKILQILKDINTMLDLQQNSIENISKKVRRGQISFIGREVQPCANGYGYQRLTIQRFLPSSS